MASPVSDEPHALPETRSGPADPGRALRRVVRSFGYAFEGLITLVRTQPNFWVHLAAAAAALALSILLRLSLAEIALVALTIGLVLVTEAFNTVLETLCDVVSPTFHPLIKRAKDVAAAAVLLAALAAVAVALLLFLPHLPGSP